jgi:UDP-N-acetylmuramoyl-tripeptide--D-alanyl-D-alanine ligase
MAMLTAIGPAHLKGLGSVEGVLEEKLDLLRCLPADGIAILNGDDPIIRNASIDARCKKVYGGLEFNAGVEAPPSWSPTHLTLPSGVVVEQHLPSKTLVRNLWLALLAAKHLGFPMDSFSTSIQTLVPAKMRGEVVHIGNANVIVDCYNANPLSMAAALDHLTQIQGQRIAVLGEMFELGDETQSRHRALGELAAGCDLQLAIFIGASAEAFAQGAQAAKFPVETYATLSEAEHRFTKLLQASGTILLKASRGMAFEGLLKGDDHD